MRSYRWTVILVLLSLLVGAYPVAAEVRPIDPAQPPAPILEPAEREKLAALLEWTLPVLASQVSPDDRAVLIAHLKLGAGLRGGMPALEFLNVRDGTRVALDERVGALPMITEDEDKVAWRDARTAVYVSISEQEGPLLVALDSVTGAVVTTTLQVPGMPLSLAPNGSRLLVEIPAEGEGMTAQTHRRSPLDRVARRLPFQHPSGRRQDAPLEAFQQPSAERTLAVFDLTSRQLVPLVTLPPDIALAHPGWSWTPDGSKLALIRQKRSPRRPLPVEDVAVQEALGNVPPAQNPFLQSNVVDVFDLARGELQPAALKAAGGDGDRFGLVAWSLDGQTLLTQRRRPAQLRGRRYPIYQNVDRSTTRFYNAKLEPIGGLDRPEVDAPHLSFPLWLSPDEVLYTAPVGLHWRMHYYNRVSGEFRPLPLPDGTFHQVRATRQSRQVIFVHSSFERPYEVYRANWDGSGVESLTRLNAQVATMNKIRADQVSFKMKRGATRTGYLVQPAGAAFPPQNVPIVLWQEGGPGNWMTSQWGGMIAQPASLLPNFGIAVLVLPLQSREGHGPAFINALADGRNFGQIDIDEAVEAVQQMIKRGWTSQGRVGITGCSYGGYFTAQSITRHPGVYAAANAQCSLLDMMWVWHEEATVDAAFLMGRAPADDPTKEYLKDSPIYNAAKVRTPLLMFHGTEDWLPVEQAIAFHDKVAATGTPAELLTFQGEFHALAQLTSNMIAGQAQIAWFRKYLQGPGGPTQLPETGEEGAPLHFPETGYSLDSVFRQYWQTHGGLPVFGYPIDSARQVDGQVSQWLERARFELHPEKQAPYNVLLGRLGVEALERAGIDWRTLPKADARTAHYFRETGQAIAPEFWSYWSSYGLEFDGRRGSSVEESLALFGYPISAARMETNASGDHVLTQWFERARFEYHPTNPEAHRVLLGRLGAELRSQPAR